MLSMWFIKGTVFPPPSRVIFLSLNHNSWPHYVAKVRNFRRETHAFQQDKVFDTLLVKEMELQKSKPTSQGFHGVFILLWVLHIKHFQDGGHDFVV